MLAEPGAALNIGPRAQHGKRSRSWPYAPNVVEKLFGKSGWIQDRGSESGQMGSKSNRSAASCRQRSPVEGSSAIFQTVSEGEFSEVRRLAERRLVVDGLIAVGLLCIVVALILATEVRSNRGRETVGMIGLIGIVCLVVYFLFR